MATYATLAEFKAQLRITDSGDDVALQLALDAAERCIDQALDTVTVQLSTPVAAPIRQALYLQAERWFKRRDAPFGVLGAADFGQFVRMQSKLDPDVELMISGNGERLRWGTTV